jgi:uncharacterized protein (DUF433 family)
MTLPLEPVTVPLRREDPPRKDDLPVYRVGDSRVSLDSVLGAYRDGADPDSIARAYDTLTLADVYAVLAWYLRHREEADAYLAARQAAADRLRREIEAAQPGQAGLREKLLAVQAQRAGQDHAATRQ